MAVRIQDLVCDINLRLQTVCDLYSFAIASDCVLYNQEYDWYQLSSSLEKKKNFLFIVSQMDNL